MSWTDLANGQQQMTLEQVINRSRFTSNSMQEIRFSPMLFSVSENDLNHRQSKVIGFLNLIRGSRISSYLEALEGEEIPDFKDSFARKTDELLVFFVANNVDDCEKMSEQFT